MHEARRTRLAEALDQILDTLITRYEPDKVILYGSMATGDVHEWSDLVIIKETTQPFFRRLAEVALLCSVWVGVDYLVYTPAELAQMVAVRNPFIIKEVVERGTVLYERETAALLP